MMQTNISLLKIGTIDELYDTVNLRVGSPVHRPGWSWRTIAQVVTYNREESYLLLQYFDDRDRHETGFVHSPTYSVPLALTDAGIPATVEREASNYPPTDQDDEPDEDEEGEYDPDL